MKPLLSILLPLREKVSAQPMDEGSRRPVRRANPIRFSTPHPTRFAGHLLPQGEKENANDIHA
jgi:hypothetical protein